MRYLVCANCWCLLVASVCCACMAVVLCLIRVALAFGGWVLVVVIASLEFVCCELVFVLRVFVYLLLISFGFAFVCC